jgi:myosin heavy subunit
MNEHDSPAGKKNSSLFAVIIILALAIVGLIIWQFSMRSHLNSLIAEKEKARVDIQKDLDSLMSEHEQVKQLYGTLSDSLMVKDSVIQANAIEIKRLLDTEWEYYKVKKKLGQLQLIAQGYVRQMDSLYRVNATLTEENQTIKKDLKELRKEKEGIEKDKQDLTEKVGIASVLRAYNAKATGVRFKSGGDKEVETDKAQKVDQVKVCFTIAENKIASPGRKQVYVRIARPDKEILTKSKLDDNTFEFEGKKIQYSMLENIDYENDAVDLCLYWKKSYSGQEMPAGLYHVDIFCEGSEIGNTTFILR